MSHAWMVYWQDCIQHIDSYTLHLQVKSMECTVQGNAYFVIRMVMCMDAMPSNQIQKTAYFVEKK